MIYCPICRSKADDIGQKKGYELGKCSSCGHIFVVNTPDEATLHGVYKKYSFEHRSLDKIPPYVFNRLAKTLLKFDKYRKNNNFLDVGFGAGSMLYSAQKAGWNVYGVEKSELAVKQAIQNGFRNIVLGDFLKTDFDIEFDVVVLDGTLEHLLNPLEFIEKARRLLRRGGLLYITTPNGNGITSRLLKMDWSPIDPPEHVNIFCPRSIRNALRGFSDIKIDTEGFNIYEIKKYFSGGKSKTYAEYIKANAAINNNKTASAIRDAINLIMRAFGSGDTLKIHAIKE